MWKVRMQLFGHSKKNRVATVVRKMTAKKERAQQHNSTSGKREKIFHVEESSF
jgi:hypothetical protein